MRIAQGLMIGAVAGAIGVACLWQFGCDDKPTEPKPPVEPKDYPVYFYNEWNSILFVFHPSTRKLDSIVIDFDDHDRGVTVSADGRLLYFSQNDRLSVLTADSLRLVVELPYGGPTAISPDGYLLAIMGQDFYVLRTTDWEVVFSDTTRLNKGVFSSDSKILYVGRVDDGEFFNCISWLRPLDSSPALSCYALPGPPLKIAPMSHDTRLLAYLLHRFVVYDTLLDSILFEAGIWPGQGSLAMTPNGRHAFFSNPTTTHGEPGTNDVYVFDTRANRVCDTFHIDEMIDSLGILMPGVGNMVVTPDNRWLVAHDSGFGPNVLILYDLTLGEAVYMHDFGNNHWFMNLSVQQDI